jgi:hypothetical protein
MKLSRQTTNDTAVIEGTRSHFWGRSLYFIIENAPRAHLVAIDELLDAAGWKAITVQTTKMTMRLGMPVTAAGT